MTARVFSSGSAPVESQSINVAWANVGLSGGIYYWSTIPNPPKATQENAPAHAAQLHPARSRPQTSGTAIYRYDFTNGTAGADGHLDRRRRAEEHAAVPGRARGREQQRRQGALHRLPRDQQRRQVHGADDRRFGEPTRANIAILDIGQQSLININPTRQHRSEQLADRQLQRLLEEVPGREASPPRTPGARTTTAWSACSGRSSTSRRSPSPARRAPRRAHGRGRPVVDGVRVGSVLEPGRQPVRVHVVRPARTSASTTPTGSTAT